MYPIPYIGLLMEMFNQISLNIGEIAKLKLGKLNEMFNCCRKSNEKFIEVIYGEDNRYFRI